MFYIYLLCLSAIGNLCYGTDILCSFNETSLVLPQAHLPKELALPDKYSIVVRFTDWSTNSSALVSEIRTSSFVQIKKISRSGISNYVLGKFNLTFNSTSCSTFDNLSTIDPPYILHEEVSTLLGFNGFSIKDLIDGIIHRNFTIGENRDTVIVGGIDSVHWLGCDNQSYNPLALQVDVAYSASHSIPPYSSLISNPIVQSVYVTLFNTTNDEAISRMSFYITEMELLPSNFFDEPFVSHGVFCNGMKFSDYALAVPDHFETSFELLDSDSSRNSSYDINMLYDDSQRIISFHLNGSWGRDLPVLGNGSLPRSTYSVNVVQDFSYGIQYVVSDFDGICYSISGIDKKFGVVSVLDKGTGFIDMKPPSEIFFNISGAKFYYGGKRLSDDFVSLKVFVSRLSSSAPSQGWIVIEVLHYDGVDSASSLHSIIQYHKSNNDTDLSKTIIRFHSLENRKDLGTDWRKVSVDSCFKFIENRYLYVKVNASLITMEKVGVSSVKNALRKVIAESAGVSVLRVNGLFLLEAQGNAVAYFIINEASGVSPANTKNRLNETSASAAVALLNSTLMERDLNVTIIDADSRKSVFILEKLSLGVMATSFLPLPDSESHFTGYNGGSMLILGIFMFFIGGCVTVCVSFLVWKRQRISGLAYQVFE